MEELLNLSSEGRRALVVGRFETLEEQMSLCGNGDELKAQRRSGAQENGCAGFEEARERSRCRWPTVAAIITGRRMKTLFSTLNSEKGRRVICEH